MLRVEGVTVRYGDHTAVDRFDLDVGEAEVVTLLGPSGCGKSSILRAIAGLVPIAGGRVLVDGSDVTNRPPHTREVGLMFQEYALFPHRDVVGNVAFGPRMHGDTREAVARRVDEVLALVGLSGYGARSVVSLSGGEQQRVALARALAPKPRVLMLDEPLGSLDRSLRERLTGELRALFVDLGLTVVTVTHDQGEAFTLADRVLVLRDGVVSQIGRPVDVWRGPADAFVARFLGFGNVFEVVARDGRIDTPWGPMTAGNRPDGDAALVIRPDGLRLARTGAEGVAGPATFRGDHFLVPVMLRTGWTLEVTDRSGEVPEPGTSVRVELDPNHVVLTAP
ncbi:MAG TPA: ABC transporter ATP-binding protein [Acidimicrobiales bacterium]|jgi:thiamine transport system ATP-binding protein|nr:ABC transporter ATP-binding protein [Acidimicrobiales bacterium]